METLELEISKFAPPKKGYKIPNRRICAHLINSENGLPQYINARDNNTEVIVRFSRTTGGLGKADITLYNLHPLTISEFTQTSYLPRVPNRIKIYAGYEISDDKSFWDYLGQPIYQGYILWAAPVGISDVALHIEAMEDYPALNADISLSPADGGNPDSTTSFDIINTVLDGVRLTPDYSAFDGNKTLMESYEFPYGMKFKNYSFSGKIVDFLNEELFKFNRMQYSIDSGVVYLRPNSEDENAILSTYDIDIDAFIGSQITEDVNGVQTTSKFGTVMIGAPDVSYYGVRLKVLFTKALKSGDRFKLNSKLYPKFNLVYEIINITYDLQLRGQNFYMYLECIRAKNSK